MQPQYITLGPKAIDITGQRFGRLTALGPIGKTAGGHILWLCRCDCCALATVDVAKLRNGHTTSCGCRVREGNVFRNTTHGMSKDRLYNIRRNMIKRCHNPRNGSFPGYGGRGIVVCDEWRRDFAAFYNYVISLDHCGEEGYSLDRIDNDGNYEPGNVRWATCAEQNRNSRRNVMITHNDKIQCIADWANELGINKGVLRQRLHTRGWSTERALLTPVERGRNRRDNHLITYQDRTMCLADWAAEIGVNPSTLSRRIKYGWSVERVLTTPVKKRKNA